MAIVINAMYEYGGFTVPDFFDLSSESILEPFESSQSSSQSSILSISTSESISSPISLILSSSSDLYSGSHFESSDSILEDSNFINLAAFGFLYRSNGGIVFGLNPLMR